METRPASIGRVTNRSTCLQIRRGAGQP